MKIGILTHHYINNYGAFLQCYALQKTLCSLSGEDEVYVINYINLKHSIINTGGWFRFYGNRENLRCWISKITVPAQFAKARKAYMHLTPKCYIPNDVNSLEFDCIIIGSDEVWNFTDRKSNDKIKFGCGLKCKKIVAYAPSVGSTQTNHIPQYVKDGINGFYMISARDDLTEEIIGKITDKKIHRVLDPTFLTEIPTEEVKGIKKPYMLFYYSDGLKEKERIKLFEYAKSQNLSAYGAGECDRGYAGITVSLTPFQWAWLFKNAECVVTGTFHGAVFSLLNHKQFACSIANDSRFKKTISLLKEFELSNRIVKGSSQIISSLETKIDYDLFDVLAEQKRKESIDFLKNALGGG